MENGALPWLGYLNALKIKMERKDKRIKDTSKIEIMTCSGLRDK